MSVSLEFRFYPLLPPPPELQAASESLVPAPTVWVAKAMPQDPVQLQRQCMQEDSGAGHWTLIQVYQMNWEEKIIYLGRGLKAKQVLESLDADEAFFIRHVVIEWGPCEMMQVVATMLAKRCPNLCTVIFQGESWFEGGEFDLPNPGATPELAVVYQRIVDPMIPEWTTGDAQWLRVHLLNLFGGYEALPGGVLPKVHFIAPHEMDVSFWETIPL